MMWLNVAHAQSFMPTKGTQVAAQVDNLYGFTLIASLIACVILIGGMIYFAWKYKRKSANDHTPYISHNSFLEFLWSFIPLVLFLGIFGWGWYIYHQMRTFPSDALEIHVYGKQWAWEMVYKSGVKTANLIVAPVNKDVKLILTSNDVIHSFYVPSFRIKQDAVPGKYTAVGFKADKLGEYHVFCTEFCGTSHSNMMATVKIVTEEEYNQWLNEEAQVGSLPLAQRGEKLFQVKACASCHSVADAAVKVGPTLWKKWETTEELDNGEKVTIDENYVRESIVESQAKIVKGFGKGVMPSYQGQLNETELSALVEYIKSLK